RTVGAAVVATVLAGGLLSACATGGSTQPGGAVSANSTPSSTPSGHRSYPPGFPISPVPTGPDKTAQAGELTMTGLVEAGVERGCLLMTYGTKKYLLLGGDANVIKEGARVTVTGRPNPHLLSYCQQGEPFQVSDAHPAP